MPASNLFLASGETFSGHAPSWQTGAFSGEIVFTTGMSGYVETLTDPSYKDQIIVFTYPLIGNYGVPDPEFWESEKIHARGVVIGSLSPIDSHWQSQLSFEEWLKEQGIFLLEGVDTRSLTLALRKQGSCLGSIGEKRPGAFYDPNQTDLVSKVSIQKPLLHPAKGKKRIVLVDCGMKQNILRALKRFDLEILQVPFDYDYSEEPFDGIFLSNGPGDPTRCKTSVAILKKAMAKEKPTFGICLGTQLLALAVEAKTYKLRFGHRGQNQPCFSLQNQKSYLTSQNHGYAIDKETLPKGWEVSFENLNDGSVEGISHQTLPFSAVQFHPESTPGPNDTHHLFEAFYELL